ncbi:hypothetical protein, partial [Rhizobium sp. WSM1325]|uniref:hypothetical protein n=1 Tax=Rhizobium sp. WSM1325 TaxID=3444086 RepID=UPI0019D47A76
QGRVHQGRSRRRAAPEPPDIPSLLNSPQINATIESRHYGASKLSFSTQSALSCLVKTPR